MSVGHGESRGLSWIRWGAIAAPVVLIGVFTLANRLSGPRQARADESVGAEPQGGPAIAKPKDVVAVERWISEHNQPVTSPFEAAPISEPTKESAGTAVSSSTIKLTGVFRSHDTTIAAINGKLYREGQEVRSGVTLKGVDVDGRKVILSMGDGREVEVVSGTSVRVDW
jgi:hypothetical protein